MNSGLKDICILIYDGLTQFHQVKLHYVQYKYNGKCSMLFYSGEYSVFSVSPVKGNNELETSIIISSNINSYIFRMEVEIPGT